MTQCKSSKKRSRKKENTAHKKKSKGPIHWCAAPPLRQMRHARAVPKRFAPRPASRDNYIHTTSVDVASRRQSPIAPMNQHAIPPVLASLDLPTALPTVYQQLIFKTHYARIVPANDGKSERRERWDETVRRTIHALTDVPNFPEATKVHLARSLAQLKVLPSMRVLMTAGPALSRENMCAYNCTYIPIDSIKAFSEVMYLLSCGTGVGFSCEKKVIDALPVVPATISVVAEKLVIQDSAVGWALGLRRYMSMLWRGEMPREVDYSLIRPAGARLKTMGGRASGPEPFKNVIEFARETILQARGRKLRPVEVHELVCKIAEAIVSGGVRRSSLISLSDLEDQELATIKSGHAWFTSKKHLSCANNSAVFDGKVSREEFFASWQLLADSKSGERGLFNRNVARHRAEMHGRREYKGVDFGMNPCGEIFLRPRQMCNLSEVPIRADDTRETIRSKVIDAALFGTLQARLTNFNEEVLDRDWRKNGEHEALLGVSLSGIMDNAFMSTPSPALADFLEGLRATVNEVNREWAKRLGIRPSAASTTIKPSGTASQMCGTSSGIHPRWSPFYERRVQIDVNDAALEFVKKEIPQIPVEASSYNKSHAILVYPIKSPIASAAFASNPNGKQMTSIHQLELVKFYNDHWCEHNVSASVYVTDTPKDWAEVGEWVWKHFDSIAGLSFFPRDLGSYPQAPFTAITEKAYNAAASRLIPVENGGIDWTRMDKYEQAVDASIDSTHRENIGCAGGACEFVKPTTDK